MKRLTIFLAIVLFLALPLVANATYLGTGQLEIKWSGPNVGMYYGDYDGKVLSSNFGYTTDWEEIFCVSSENGKSTEDVTFYRIDSVLANYAALSQAAWIADNWTLWGITDTMKVEAQKAIWKIMGVMDTLGSSGKDVEIYTQAISQIDYVTNNWYFADSSDYQDYLTPTPEPATMLLLGFGLLGLGIIRKTS